MRLLPTLAASALALCCASQASAGCPADVGYSLLVSPSSVPIGTPFVVDLSVPEVNTLVLLLMSATPGPTPTPYGTLCVGSPFAGIFPFVMPALRVEIPHVVECVPAIIGVTGYFQFLAKAPSDPIVRHSNDQTITIIDGPCNGDIPPGDFVTYTQGAWGQGCHGGNLGCVRDANFASVFPNGMIMGDPDGVDGDGFFAIVITSAAGLEAYLPDGATPQALTQNYTNPTATDSGVLGGQLTAAKANVGFDDAGIFDSLKNNDAVKVGDMLYVDCVHPKLIGKTVRQVIAIADLMISGAAASPYDVDGDTIGDVNYSDVSTALTKFNENFDNGTVNVGCLGTP